MQPTKQQISETPLITILSGVLSQGRLATYLKAAGHNTTRALQLYIWNARVGEAFHVPIQAVEVGLRNRINAALIEQFGQNWWGNDGFLEIADKDRVADLNLVRQRIRNRDLALNTDQVVAGLSFGFWIGMLQPRYNPGIWAPHIRTAFPDLPITRARKSLAQSAARIGYLRNRIWHHEPIFKEDLLKDYGETMRLLEWICPEKAQWIRPHCRVPELLRSKP